MPNEETEKKKAPGHTRLKIEKPMMDRADGVLDHLQEQANQFGLTMDRTGVLHAALLRGMQAIEADKAAAADK